MTVIEGVGDEVFNVLLIALIVVLGIVGWWSTSISEQPLIRTVLILEPRHHAATETSANVIAPSPPQDTGQRDPTPTNEVPIETTAVPNTSSTVSKNQNQSQEQQAEAAGGTNPSSSSGQSSEEGATASVPPASNETKESTDLPSNSDLGESSSEVSTNANELRRRRLQFFEEKQGVDNPTDTSSNQAESLNERGPECGEASSSSSSNQETLEHKETPVENESSSSDPCPACDDIRIKLKFLNDNQKMVQGKLQEPLGDFKRRNFAVEMGARKVIRLIFNGQVLQSDDRTLQNYGLFDNCVVHCLVHNQRGTNQNVDNATNGNTGEDVNLGGVEMGEREWDMSSVLYISTFVILTAIWYLRINFSQMFSATSTVALFGLSGIFVIFLVGMYIPDQEVLRT